MSLREYNRKRSFTKTPEPKGQRSRTRGGWRFVVQKHDASRLHYDFRLELDGVLKSWAIPKGPSLDPRDKRLAVHVEDHPLDYGNFEGVIPQGEYGGGTVILWDRGIWKPLEDAEQGYRRGRLKFQLRGKKLRGSWMLVRMPTRGGEKADNWLLIKERDDKARAAKEYDITREAPDSVKSGRSLAQVAAAGDRVWKSNKRATSQAKARESATASGSAQRGAKKKSPTRRS